MRTTASGKSAEPMLRPVANTRKPASTRPIATPLPTPRLAPVTSALGMSLRSWRLCVILLRGRRGRAEEGVVDLHVGFLTDLIDDLPGLFRLEALFDIGPDLVEALRSFLLDLDQV